MPPESPVLETISTSPMVIAVRYEWDGRWWPGRLSEWLRTPDGWWAYVMGEQASYKAGAGGGWYLADQLEPSDHEVATTHQAYNWWSWTPPPLPAELTRFGAAAWNEREWAHAERIKPDRFR